jgi:hypothetical protein
MTERVRRSFTFQLFNECVRGKTPEQLADETGIPLDRVVTRIRGAMTYMKEHVEEVAVIRIAGKDTLLGTTDSSAIDTRVATMTWIIDF